MAERELRKVGSTESLLQLHELASTHEKPGAVPRQSQAENICRDHSRPWRMDPVLQQTPVVSSHLSHLQNDTHYEARFSEPAGLPEVGVVQVPATDQARQEALVSQQSLHHHMQHRLDQERLDRTAIQLEAQQRILDQQQEFLDQQQRLLVAVQHQQHDTPSTPLQTALQMQQLQQGHLQQSQVHQEPVQQNQQHHDQAPTSQLHHQQVLTQQMHLPVTQLSQLPLQNSLQEGSAATRLRSFESDTEQVATSEEATPSLASQPSQVFGSGTIKQIVFDSLCAGNKNENPVTFVNSQGGQITILKNATKGPSTSVPGTVVTIDGKRHFFPSDPVPLPPADLGDSCAPGGSPRGRAQGDEERPSHSRDGSQTNTGGPQPDGDPLPAQSCSLSGVQGSQGSHLKNRPDTSQSQGDHELGNTLAEATSRANGMQMETGLAQQGGGARGRLYMTSAPHERPRSPSPVPNSQGVLASVLVAPIPASYGPAPGDALGQGGQPALVHSPAFSGPNSEGTNSWQALTSDGKQFPSPQAGVLLNQAQFQGSFQDLSQNPSPNSSGQSLPRHPSQQNIPSRPSTPVAILASDGTVTVTLNGFTSQAIPVITPGGVPYVSSGQNSNPTALAPSQLQANQQLRQQQNVQNVQYTQVGGQGVQLFQGQTRQDGVSLAPGPQYVQLPQGGPYQVTGGQQGFTAVGQGLPAVGSVQQADVGGHVGAGVQGLMGKPEGAQAVLYVKAQPGPSPQQVSPLQGDQLQTPVYASQGNPSFLAQQTNMAQPTQALSPPLRLYQQINTAPQGTPMVNTPLSSGGQLSGQTQPSGGTHLLQPLSAHFQPIQYDRATQQFVVDQNQLVGMRPQAVNHGALPPVQRGSESSVRNVDSAPPYGHDSLYQDSTAEPASQQVMLPAVQYASPKPLLPTVSSRPVLTQVLQQSVSLQAPQRQSSNQDSFLGGVQSAPLPGYSQPQPLYYLHNQALRSQNDPSQAPAQLSNMPRSQFFGGQHMLHQAEPISQQLLTRQQPEGKEGAAHQGGKGDDTAAGPQTTITTAHSYSESEEVQSRSGSSTQILGSGPQDTRQGPQRDLSAANLQQLQTTGRSSSPALPQPTNFTHLEDSSRNHAPPAGGQAPRPPLAPILPGGALPFVPPTPPFQGIPTTVLPALPRNLQPQGMATSGSMLRTVSSGVSAADSEGGLRGSEGGLSRVSSGHASSGGQPNPPSFLRTGGIHRTGSGLRINYVHDQADALAAATAVAVNNGLEVPDFALFQTPQPGSGGEGLVKERPEGGVGVERAGDSLDGKWTYLPESRLGRTRSGGLEVDEPTGGMFAPQTAARNAAKLVETGHVTSSVAGDRGRTTVILDPGGLPKIEGANLQTAQSLPRLGERKPPPSQGIESAASTFLRAFSKSQVLVAPPLVPPPQVTPVQEVRRDPPSLPPQKAQLGDHLPSPNVQAAPQTHGFLMRDRDSVRHPDQVGTNEAVPQTPPADEGFISPSYATAQALSFLNDEPDPNFQPQGVTIDQAISPARKAPEPPGEAPPQVLSNIPTGSERSGGTSVYPSPNTPLDLWEAASTPERGVKGADDVSTSGERKRKWEAEGAGARGSLEVSDMGGKRNAEGGAVDTKLLQGGEGERPRHSREISLMDGLFPIPLVDEEEERKVKKSSEGRANVQGQA